MLPGIDDGRFRTIYADPPWTERGAGKIKRGADRHYPLVPTPEIPGVMKGAMALGAPLWKPASDAHLYLAVTNNFLEDGLWVMRELDFRYVTNLSWTKMKGGADLDADIDQLADETRSGIGQYFRGEHELILFGVRGQGMSPAVYTGRRDLGSSILAKHERRSDGQRIHSRKPVDIYERIEARSHGPYLELFARAGRPGWVSWGNDPAVAPAAP
ncbi:MAG TPA: MT-A70 family methyltransferase [Myxococcota bacterium]